MCFFLFDTSNSTNIDTWIQPDSVVKPEIEIMLRPQSKGKRQQSLDTYFNRSFVVDIILKQFYLYNFWHLNKYITALALYTIPQECHKSTSWRGNLGTGYSIVLRKQRTATATETATMKRNVLQPSTCLLKQCLTIECSSTIPVPAQDIFPMSH